VNDRTDSKDTPLHLALENGRTEVAVFLLNRGANENAIGNWGKGMIHIAAGERGNHAIVELLVRKGMKVTARDGNGMLPIHHAARYGRMDIMKWLAAQGSPLDTPSNISREIDMYEFGDDKIRTYGALRPLHEACSGQYEAAKWLLEQGASVNARTASGDTPLILATGNADIVKLLLEHGADAKAANRYGTTALHKACDEYGYLETVRALLDHGADPNAADSAGTMPIHAACFNGGLEITQLLVSRGADMHARNGSGQTPLARAAGFYPYPELVDFLIKKGADVNAVDDQGNSVVAGCAHTPILRKLLRRGANVNTANWAKRTPLHDASARENGLERMRLLIAHGAAINVADSDGNTPLHDAALWGYLENVKLLVSRGADVDAKNHDGKTPADETLRFNDSEQRRLTREYLMPRMTASR
jgi:uncharacterized protein